MHADTDPSRTRDGAMTLATLVFGFGGCEKLIQRRPTRSPGEMCGCAETTRGDFDQVIEETVRFVEQFDKTRPAREVFVPDADRRKNSRTPGKGHTGREEWM